MIKLSFQLKKTIILCLLISLFRFGEIQEDQIGEVEYIKVQAHSNWKFSLEYFRFDEQTKTYFSIQKIDQFECNMSSNKRHSVIHFQVNNDLRQVVLQGEQRQTNTDDSIIKIPLINVLKKNIMMKPLCQLHQIDLFIYNFDHEFEGVQHLVYLTRIINKFQQKNYAGYKFDLMKLDLNSQNLEYEQNLSGSLICNPSKPMPLQKFFKLEFYVISGDGKIISRIKRKVTTDENLNLMPLMINSLENRAPHCFWHIFNDTFKIILRQMKFKREQNEHEDYTLIQYQLAINDDQVEAQFYRVDEQNKEFLISECKQNGLEYFKSTYDFEFKYFFIKGKRLLTEFSSQNREQLDTEIKDTMYISTPYISYFNSDDYNCVLQFIENSKDKKVYVYAYLKHHLEKVDELMEEEKNLRLKSLNNNYENVLKNLGDKIKDVIDQKILEEEEQEIKQTEIQKEGVKDELVEEFSEEELENESESFQEDSETEKAIKARDLYRKDRINKMQNLLQMYKDRQEQEKITTIKQEVKQYNQPLQKIQQKKQNLGFNFGAINKMNSYESSEETINKYKEQKKQLDRQNQVRNIRARQFQNFKRKKSVQKNSMDSSEDIPYKRNRLKIEQTDSRFQQPFNFYNQNNYKQKRIDPRIQRFKPVSKEKFLKDLKNFNLPEYIPQTPQQFKKDQIQQFERQNQFQRNNHSNQELKQIRSNSLSPVKLRLRQPIQFNQSEQEIEHIRQPLLNKKQILAKIEDLSDKIQGFRRSRFNNFRKELYNRQRSKPVQQRDNLRESDNDQNQQPKLKIKVVRKISPQRKQELENLKQKLYHENKWFIELQNNKLFIKKGDHNVENEENKNQECRPFNNENVQYLEKISEQAKRNMNIQWISEENIFKREIQWEQISDNQEKGVWILQQDQTFQDTEFLLRFKLNQQHHYCMYKVHKEYTEIMFIRTYSNVTYHQVEFSNDQIKYQIFGNYQRRLIMTCEQNISNLQNMPLILAYFTDSFGVTQQLKQKMISITKFQRKFLIYDKENNIFPPQNVFCAIDKGEYQFKQRIALRSFEIPQTQNFQFVQAYFKDFKLNIFDLHYQQQPQIQIHEYDFSEQFQDTDLSTFFYIVNTFIHQNITSKTNLVSNGYKIRLPYLLLANDDQKREINVKINHFQNSNFLFIYLLPQNKPNMQVLRSGLFLTSNFQLNYFLINDHNGTIIEKTLERNEQIDNFIRIRQTNNQFFLYKNNLMIENYNNDKSLYINIHEEPIQLLEGYYLETSLLDCLPDQYSMSLSQAKVKLDSFSIRIEQKLNMIGLI